ncbi:hypothetical protein P3T16_006600, partial [Paraburkholderia sp. GAS42]
SPKRRRIDLGKPTAKSKVSVAKTGVTIDSGLVAVRGRRDYPLGVVRDAGLPRAGRASAITDGRGAVVGNVTCLLRAREWRVPLRTMAPGIVCPFEYHDSLVTAFRLAPVAEANLINYLWPLLLVLPGTSV